jgi:hypothetical protein
MAKFFLKTSIDVFKFFLVSLFFGSLVLACDGTFSSPKPSSFKVFIKGLRHDLDHVKNMLGHRFTDVYNRAEQVLDAIDNTIDMQEVLQQKESDKPATEKKLRELNREALATLAYFQQIMDVLQQAIADAQAQDSLKPYTQTEQKRLLVTAPHELKTSRHTKKKAHLPPDNMAQEVPSQNYTQPKYDFDDEDHK